MLVFCEYTSFLWLAQYITSDAVKRVKLLAITQKEEAEQKAEFRVYGIHYLQIGQIKDIKDLREI